MKVVTKFLMVALLMGSVLSYASNTITNKTGQRVLLTLNAPSGNITNSLQKEKTYTFVADQAVTDICIKIYQGYAMCDNSYTPLNNLTIDTSKSYDLTLASDKKTLVLSEIVSNFKKPKTDKPGNPGK